MPGWEQRISQREAVSLACLGTLLAQARLLIADAAMQSSTLAALAQIRKVIRRAASIHLILPPRNAGARSQSE